DAPTRPRAVREEPPTIQFDEPVPPTRVDTEGSPSAAWVLGGALLAGLVLLAMNQLGAFDPRETAPPPIEIDGSQLPEEPAPRDAAGLVTEDETVESEVRAEPSASKRPSAQPAPQAPSEAPAAGPTGWEIRR
ncbi:MAG: hypothetical protein OEP95_13855, partial [Myxococcales bacterium]|nr:hypothetical protein [Myxococcales bacterium]